MVAGELWVWTEDVLCDTRMWTYSFAYFLVDVLLNCYWYELVAPVLNISVRYTATNAGIPLELKLAQGVFYIIIHLGIYAHFLNRL
jgi:hypothetical protein